MNHPATINNRHLRLPETIGGRPLFLGITRMAPRLIPTRLHRVPTQIPRSILSSVVQLPIYFALCCQGPTEQDSYTVSELIGHLTELAEGMTANQMCAVC